MSGKAYAECEGIGDKKHALKSEFVELWWQGWFWGIWSRRFFSNHNQNSGELMCDGAMISRNTTVLNGNKRRSYRMEERHWSTGWGLDVPYLIMITIMNHNLTSVCDRASGCRPRLRVFPAVASVRLRSGITLHQDLLISKSSDQISD